MTWSTPIGCALLLVAGCTIERRQDVVCDYVYPTYDGPLLTVWVGTFDVDDAACTELDRVARDVVCDGAGALRGDPPAEPLGSGNSKLIVFAPPLGLLARQAEVSVAGLHDPRPNAASRARRCAPHSGTVGRT